MTIASLQLMRLRRPSDGENRLSGPPASTGRIAESEIDPFKSHAIARASMHYNNATADNAAAEFFELYPEFCFNKAKVVC